MTTARVPTVAAMLTDDEADALLWACRIALKATLDPELGAAMLPRVKQAEERLGAAVAHAEAPRGSERPPRGPQREGAMAFLVQLLASAGPLQWGIITEFGRAAGYTEITLRRVRRLVARKVRKSRRTYWALALTRSSRDQVRG